MAETPWSADASDVTADSPTFTADDGSKAPPPSPSSSVAASSGIPITTMMAFVDPATQQQIQQQLTALLPNGWFQQ